MKKVGIMGGTFDPIHIGHLILGEAAYEQLELDRLLFLPAGNPPHKRHREGRASDEQRAEMTRLAIADNPHFENCLMEMDLEGYTYTYRTLEILKEQNPDCDYYFIIGLDSLKDFDGWMKPERIAAACHLVVATRDSVDPEMVESLLEEKRMKYHGDFIHLNSPNIDVASHELRQRVRDGLSIRYYVPDEVIRYIDENHIYR